MLGNTLLFGGSVIALAPSFYGVINGLSLLGLMISIYGAYVLFRQGSEGV